MIKSSCQEIKCLKLSGGKNNTLPNMIDGEMDDVNKSEIFVYSTNPCIILYHLINMTRII